MRISYEMPQTIVEVVAYTQHGSVDDYSEFYHWLQNVLEKDRKSILQKKLEYLKEIYDELGVRLSNELNLGECYERLRMIDKCKDNRKKLRKYIDNTMNIYDAINGLEVHNNYYAHYDNLGSWYSAQIDSTNRVLNKLSVTVSERKDEGQKYTYIDVNTNGEYYVVYQRSKK